MNQNQNKILGLDVGARRIGVALASMVARIASPLGVIDRQQTEAFVAIKSLIEREDIAVVVVGLPRGMSGQETDQTRVTREFARELESAIEIPVVMQDETGTSLEAEARLKARGKPYGKGEIDSEAAAIILQDYVNESVGKTV